MRNLLIEVLRYGLVSAVALAVDTSILYLFVNIVGWHYLPASALAFSSWRHGCFPYVLSVRVSCSASGTCETPPSSSHPSSDSDSPACW